MTAKTIAPPPKLQFFDNNGNPLTGGKLFTYAAGTASTKLATYTTAAGSTANANPIILDSRGECNCWFTPSLLYKLVLAPSTDTDPPTNPFWTVDNLPGSGAQFPSQTTMAGLRTMSRVGVTFCTVLGYYTAGDGGGGNYYYDSSDTTSGAYFTGVISGTTLTVTAVTNGTLAVGQVVTRSDTGAVVAWITALGSGSGGTGTYTISASATVASMTMMADNGGTIIVAGDGGRWKRTDLDVLTLRMFGAKGDGVADDKPACQAALNSGHDLIFPDGVFSCGSGLTISTTGQSIFGFGENSIIRQSAVGYDLFTVTVNNVSIQDLQMQGPATAATAGTLYFAVMADAAAQPNYLNIRRVKFSGSDSNKGFYGAVKYNSGCNYGTVDQCQIERLWGGAGDCGYGILAGNVTSLEVINCRGIAASGRGRHMVYLSAGASDCLVSGNYAYGFNEAAYQQFSQGGQPICYRNTFSDNYAISCSSNGTSTSSSLQISGHSQDAKVIGNQISGSGRNGISVYNYLLTDCSDTLVSENTIRDSKYYGIWVSGVKGATLQGNKVSESSRVSSGTYSNIQIESDDVTPVATTNVIVAGNNSDGASFAKSAIAIAGTTPPTGVILSEDNYFPVCVTSDIEVNSGITVIGALRVGSWTPALKFGGGNTGLTTSTNLGYYIRTGKQVVVSCHIILTAKGSSTGLAEIYGLPFNAGASVGAASLHLNTVTFADFPQAYVDTNWIQLQEITNAGVVTNLTDADFSNTSRVKVTATYFMS